MIFHRDFRKSRKGIGTVFAMVFFLLIVMLVFASFMIILNKNTGLEQTIIQSRQMDNDKAKEQLTINLLPSIDLYSNGGSNSLVVNCLVNNTGTLPVTLKHLWVQDNTTNTVGDLAISLDIQQGDSTNYSSDPVIFPSNVQVTDQLIFWFVTSRGNQFTIQQSTNGGMGSQSEFDRYLSNAMGDFIPDYDSFQWAEVNQDHDATTAQISTWNNGWIIPNENDPFPWHHWWHNNVDQSPYIIFRFNLTYFGDVPIRLDQKTGLWISSLSESGWWFFTDNFDENLFIALPSADPNYIGPYTLGHEVLVNPSSRGTPVTLYFAINDEPNFWEHWYHGNLYNSETLGVRVNDLPSSSTVSMTIYGMSPSNYSQTFPLYSIQTRPFPKITISPTIGPVGTAITVSGEHFALQSPLTIAYNGVSMVSSTTGSDGTFSNVGFNVPASSFGNNIVTATDANGNTVNANFTVTPFITLDSSSSSIGSTVQVTGHGFNASKGISITFPHSAITVASTSTNGSGSFHTSFIVQGGTVGNQIVTATDDDSNSASGTLFVSKGTASVSASSFVPDSPITFGSSVSVSASVSAPSGVTTIPTGSVQFQVKIGAAAYVNLGSAVALSSGSASITYTPQTVTTYLFQAVYQGDTNYVSGTAGGASGTLTVNKGTAIVGACSFTPSSPITLGTSVTASVTVSGVAGITPTGTITFQVSTNSGSTWSQFGAVKTLSSGSATSDSYTPLAASGAYRFNAVYSGDVNYNGPIAGAAASLTVKNTPHYVDTATAVHDVSVGTHSSFQSMQTAPDGIYDTLTEDNTVLTTTIMGTTTDTSTSYTSIAANRLAGQAFTAPTNAISVASITFYGGTSSGTFNVKAIITDSLGNILTNGVSNPVSCTTTLMSRTATFTTPPSITPGSTYWILIVSQTSNFRLYYVATTGGISKADNSNSYTTPTSPTDANSATINYRAFYATVNRANNQLDSEVQFTGVTNFATYNQLQIQTGTFSSPEEVISVDYWTGTSWSNLGTLTAHSLNMFSISLTSDTYELRFTDGTGTNDNVQSTWQIDSVYIW
jgi:hypothetical protein